MINGRTVKLLALTAAVLLVFWWTARQDVPLESVATVESERLESVIEPISEADAVHLLDGSVSDKLKLVALDEKANEDLKGRFELALADIQANKSVQAIEGLNKLIADYPHVSEPYANLGALYAREGDLEQARQTLKAGLEQNVKSRALFVGLQKVHGALAANAYQKALDATSPEARPDPVILPLMSSVSTAIDEQQTIAELQAQLLGKPQPASDTTLQQLSELQAQFEKSEQNLLAAQVEYQSELDKLRDQIASLSEDLTVSRAAEDEAQTRALRAEELASLRPKESSTTSGSENEEEPVEEVGQQQELDGLFQQQPVIEESLVSQEPLTDLPLNDNLQEQKAIELVLGWARVWSAQDVTAYVDYYRDDYLSENSLSREDWLEQRHARLTDKEFIEVSVSEFVVQNLGQQFSVTFTQHYRSDTVDDTIRKRLTFVKQGGDWSQAKIVNENRVES